MSSTWGSNLKISIFGESHSKAIGIVIDGIPAGTVIDRKQLLAFLARRSSRGGKLDTPRIEADQPQLLSGMLPDPQDPNLLVACGTPVCAMIENANTQSKDYEQLRSVARPGHADFTGFVRYHGCNDIRGGGHFSGRLTAPLCFAGAIAKQYLRQYGIEVGAHIRSIGSVEDNPFDPVTVSASTLLAVQEKFFPVLDDAAGEQMQQLIADSRDRQDSVGGVIECPGGQRNRIRAWLWLCCPNGQSGKRPVLHQGRSNQNCHQPQRRHPRRHHQRDAGPLPNGHQADTLHLPKAADGQLPHRSAGRAYHHRTARPVHRAPRRALHRICRCAGADGFSGRFASK